MSIKIAAICGSLRAASFNRLLLNAAVKLCPAGATMEVVEWADVPVFNQDLESNLPESVKRFKAQVAAADAVLFVTPEYNYSIPGPLKNLVDWGSRPYGTSCWSGKAVSIMGTSPGKYSGASGTGRAQYHLRQTFVFLDMHPVQQPEVMVTDSPGRFNEKGELSDEFFQKKIPENLEALIKLAKALKGAK